MRRAGFSLLEVMVALAILGMVMTALFAAEVGAFKAGHAAHRLTEGTLLARCKMAEVEAELNQQGFQLDTVEEEDEPCCADEKSDVFSCSWTIEPLDLTALESDDVGGNNPLGSLLGGDDGDEDNATRLTQGNSAQDILAGTSAASPTDMVGGLATELVWPLVAPSLTSQVRRVTVNVHWGDDEGFDVVQYVVVEPALGASLAAPAADATAPGTGAGVAQFGAPQVTP